MIRAQRGRCRVWGARVVMCSEQRAAGSSAPGLRAAAGAGRSARAAGARRSGQRMLRQSARSIAYLIVARYELVRGRAASLVVLTGTVRRSRRVRGSVICGGRSWARGAVRACEASRGGPGTARPRPARIDRCARMPRPRTWMVPGGSSRARGPAVTSAPPLRPPACRYSPRSYFMPII